MTPTDAGSQWRTKSYPGALAIRWCYTVVTQFRICGDPKAEGARGLPHQERDSPKYPCYFSLAMTSHSG